MSSGRCGRHTLGRAPPSGDARCGRHIHDLCPLRFVRNGHVDGLLHDALESPLQRDVDLLHKRVDDLLHSALLNGLPSGSRRRRAEPCWRCGASPSRWCTGHQQLVLPEGAQAALSATVGAGRAAVSSVKGGHQPPFIVRLNVATWEKTRSLTRQTPYHLMMIMMMMMKVELEMESHGSVSIMKRRSQHKTTGQPLWRVPLSARRELHSHLLAEQAHACGHLTKAMWAFKTSPAAQSDPHYGQTLATSCKN